MEPTIRSTSSTRAELFFGGIASFAVNAAHKFVSNVLPRLTPRVLSLGISCATSTAGSVAAFESKTSTGTKALAVGGAAVSCGLLVFAAAAG